MCNCVNIEIQSYDNQTLLEYPEWFKSEKRFRVAGIDNCILEEIKFLWSKGIQTLESCCGHNKEQSYITVIEDYIPNMIVLGYEPYQSNFRDESGWDENGYRADTFKAKSA